MGATVIGYYPKMDERHLEQPGFFNDDKAWASWMAELHDDEQLMERLKSLALGALATCKTDGWEDDDVEWVPPGALRQAALQLKQMVESKDEKVQPFVELYARDANGAAPVEKEFAQDLQDVANIAQYFENEKIEAMTLEVNW